MSESDQLPGSIPTGSNPVMAGWMQEIVPYGIFTTDRDLRVTSWNDWLVTHSGMRASEVIGRLLPEVFPSIIERRGQERYARALEGEVSVLSAALHKYLLPFPSTVAESLVPHMLQTVRIAPLSEARKVIGTVTIIEDVTQREFQAGILYRQQEFDRLLSASLATLLQSDDPAQEMGEIFTSVRVALGLDCFVSYLLAPGDTKLQLNASAGISPKQREVLATLPLSDADHETLQGETSPTALSVASHRETLSQGGLRAQCSFPLTVADRVVGLVVFGSYERDVIASSDFKVLVRIARYVAIALDRSRREQDTIAASRAKDDFLAALSHELRTPLNPVLLVASDAAGNPDYSDEVREAFRIIEKNALLEARLIDDLLDLTRITHGKMAIEVQPVEIQSLLNDALETVRAELKQNELSLRTDLAGNDALVAGDAGRLQQVFSNLLKNGIKFTPGGGEIAVSSRVDPSAHEVVITISDTGIGMSTEELSRIFGAFSQGDHAVHGRSHRFGGLGLGLAISRKLIEMHSGRIVAMSEGRGHGSTFTVYLPLVAAENLPGIATKSGILEKETPGSGSRAPLHTVIRILLVEDHEPTRLTLARLLVRRGFEVVTAGSAEDALKEAANGKFSLVLSDIGLPDLDGFSLMRKLRDNYRLKGIALTGYGMEEDLVRSTDAGFFAHLTKPISVKVLDRTLEQFLS
jgi:signal transduction histidine kinase/CheY-like chemotaxis protein